MTLSMNPVVRVAEMSAVDAEAVEPVETLIDRAGRAVARAAFDLLGGVYGRRVVVVAGPGNNGADGRVAAQVLRRRGVHCMTIPVDRTPPVLPSADLVIDAAYGTGLSRPYRAPDPGDATVLAVDIPSGIDGDTGDLRGHPMKADVTVTFAAVKPGLLLGAGPAHAGRIRVADIGLDVSRATIFAVGDEAVRSVLPVRASDAHKWNSGVLVIGGSPGMTGAVGLAAAAAQRAGAGMVQVLVPGVSDPQIPIEAVALDSEATSWVSDVVNDHRRARSIVVGPGLGTSMVDRHQVRDLMIRDPRPMVVDGGALTALGSMSNGEDAVEVLRGRLGPTVVTPHDGEFERLTGQPVGSDRLDRAQTFAIRSGAVVVLKGPTTTIALPTGELRLVHSGDDRLATAGTGDVLSGIIGALLASGVPVADAATAGTHLHALAGKKGPRPGAIASDVIAAIPPVWRELVDETGDEPGQA